ncbi:hypothetical protein BCV70DRAFT_218758 [Testicularia cyperi]|uniref:Uncharacterized protein n=1 Tax=Testicularia cyperi TaxID=1882483 RepID=A0A317XKC0_9BASI|nr:hypothetical protein BCV70DRAFT_218758 [Testicularia cyperi]
MASGAIAASGRSLGSRHNSHSNLVRSDSMGDWLANSDDNTPKAQTLLNGQIHPHDTLSRQDSFASLSEGFDMVSPPPLSWSNTAESKFGTIGNVGNADDYLSSLAQHSIDLKSTFTDTLHVDDLFTDSGSSSSSPYMATTISLPGWNNGPELYSGLTDSEVDSPEGVWYGQMQQPAKAGRRGLAVPNFMLNVDSDLVGSPGAANAISIDEASSPPSDAGLLAPARSLRPCISAPLLQRNDPVLAAAGTQESINDFLLDVGFPRDRIPDGSALGLMGDAGLKSTMQESSNRAGDASSMISMAAGTSSTPAGQNTGNVAQSSALFQRRAVQRDGNLSAPSPVAVPTSTEDEQSFDSNTGRLVTVNNPTADTNVDPENLTEEQRMRLAQLHQIHVAQQAARLGVYQDFVTPSQQFAGQEASERAAKAVQAALMYGMEGSTPRKLSVGTTGLPTPITPQHPLQPGPSPGMIGGNYVFQPMQLHPYGPGGSFDPRIPGMPMSADSAQFAPSIQQQFTNLHLAHQNSQPNLGQQQQLGQAVFTPQFLHQNDAGLFVGQGSASQEMAGYTSVYPPPRHHSISGGSADRGSLGLTLTGMSAESGEVLPQRRNSHMPVLRTSDSSPSLASQIAANPMQLQNPFVSLQASQHKTRSMNFEPSTLEPAKLMGGGAPISASSAGPSMYVGGMTVHPPPAATTPRSAPADASKELLTIQQNRMRQLQQQQIQFLQMQQQAKQASTSKLGAGITTKKLPTSILSAPLSPPRSPAKMKSTPHLRSPLGTSSPLPPSPGKPQMPSLRKIASNRRINAGQSMGSGSTSSSSASSTSGGASSSSSRNKGFTLELTTSAAPTRPRTISHQSGSSSRSNSSLSKSKSPTPTAAGGSSFGQLSFVNYGMDDADEICSAVAPSGSYKVPLRGFGSGGSMSSGEEEEFDDESTTTSRTRTNTLNTAFDSDDDANTPGSGGSLSPTKKVRKNPSRPALSRAGSASPLKSKRSMANVGGGASSSSASSSSAAGPSSSSSTARSSDYRFPRKTKSTILSPVSSGGSE